MYTRRTGSFSTSKMRSSNNNNNNNMYLKSSIQTSSIDYIKENIHITLNISSNIPIQQTKI